MHPGRRRRRRAPPPLPAARRRPCAPKPCWTGGQAGGEAAGGARAADGIHSAAKGGQLSGGLARQLIDGVCVVVGGGAAACGGRHLLVAPERVSVKEGGAGSAWRNACFCCFLLLGAGRPVPRVDGAAQAAACARRRRHLRLPVALLSDLPHAYLQGNPAANSFLPQLLPTMNHTKQSAATAAGRGAAAAASQGGPDAVAAHNNGGSSAMPPTGGNCLS